MVRLVTLKDLAQLVKVVGIQPLLQQLIAQLAQDFQQWQQFETSPRYAMHLPHGVMELMPTGTSEYFSYKFVNGHPGNPKHGKLTVVALGMLAECQYGYPLLLSEMTVLTALRTAATMALATQYMAREDATRACLIGCGAQAEFMLHALQCVRTVEQCWIYDIDPLAMQRVQANMADTKITCADSAQAAVEASEIVITATAAKSHARIIEDAWVKPGMHINGMGGDCPGKTEMDPAILMRSRVIVEYLPQTLVEGDIQLLGEAALEIVAGELWQVVNGQLVARQSDNEITFFDGVGFAIEDYSVLKLIHRLSEQHGIGQPVAMVPEIDDPRNLYGALLG
jgi:ornithine cyclodeaminase